jgi:hypothetical protein
MAWGGAGKPGCVTDLLGSLPLAVCEPCVLAGQEAPGAAVVAETRSSVCCSLVVAQRQHARRVHCESRSTSVWSPSHRS